MGERDASLEELPALGEIDRPLLSAYAARRKLSYFLADLPKEARILEIGSGDGIVKSFLQANGWQHYLGLDLRPPADIVGDIRRWRELGLEPGSCDAIIAFEVLEHVDCLADCYALLKPGGVLLATSPIPSRDWICRCLEWAGLSQKRGSPHSHLLWFDQVPSFELLELRTVGFLSQWGRFRKPMQPHPDGERGAFQIAEQQ